MYLHCIDINIIASLNTVQMQVCVYIAELW